jgi:hypothetical protein
MVGIVLAATAGGGRAQAQSGGGGGEPMFPFVLPWDDASSNVTNPRSWGVGLKAADRPVTVVGGHLAIGGERFRILGVNLCFGANFPTKDDAPRVAARMARLGINAVRFHHMDTSDSPNGLLQKDRRTIDPAQLDKLDFLIAQLKKNGIYSDLNLHVGRRYQGYPEWPGGPSYFKGVDNFEPSMIALQKEYARDLLTHVNPYTKIRYADEPAVALVEINNENAFFHQWWANDLDGMPAQFAGPLTKAWNAWLAAKYPTTEALRAAWGVKEEKTGAEALVNNGFTRGLEGWNLETHEGAAAEARPARDAAPRSNVMTVTVTRPGAQGWHVQFGQAGLKMEADRPYTLRFRARAETPTRITVNVSQAHDPWGPLWSTSADLKTEWTEFRHTFRPSDTDANARVMFSNLGSKTNTFAFADVSLTPGGVLGLQEGETPGRIGWFKKSEFSARTPEAQRDWLRFLYQTESDYWNGFANFLRKDLGVKSLIVGTQLGWSPATVQDDLDVVDSHAYWQHPHFPNRPWDPEDWVVRNIPMTGEKDGGTLSRLGLQRVVGKPYICTEYNHPAPLTFAGETLPLIFGYAAMQDWDGVFLFAYSHRRDAWDTGFTGSFFDLDQNPAKLVTFPAAAALFTRGDLRPSTATHYARVTEEQYLEASRTRGPWTMGEAFGVPVASALKARVGLDLEEGRGAVSTAATPGIAPGFVWENRPEGNRVTIDAQRSRALVGSTSGGPVRLGDVTIAPGPNRQGWAAITITAVDGDTIAEPGRVLITASGETANTGQRWKDKARTSVGRAWGGRPSLVEVVPAAITLPAPAAKVKAWALDERGRRAAPAPVAADPTGRAVVSIGPPAKTLWYEVEIAR